MMAKVYAISLQHRIKGQTYHFWVIYQKSGINVIVWDKGQNKINVFWNRQLTESLVRSFLKQEFQDSLV